MLMGRQRVGAVLLLASVLVPTSLHYRMDSGTPEPRPELTLRRGVVARNATLASLLAGMLSPAGIEALVQAARPVHNLARLSVGQPFGLALGPGGALAAFTYGIDELRTLRVARRGEVLAPELLARSYETRTVTVDGTIESSLFGALGHMGEMDQLAIDLADVFAWDVDFNTEIRKGDRFRVAVEKLYLDGRLSRYGRILSAELTNGTRRLRAVRFEGSRGPGYYAPDGTPLKKLFLRSPLRFSRITSGYSAARFHPILRTVTSHFGIDYAAPVGTPVTAAADGTVALAGWLGGFGNTVRVRHANGFETLYGHLSRLRVRPGQRVAQGETVGEVGSTGLSTGPHLDYRMLRAGSFVNPLAVQLPPAEPIPEQERPQFLAQGAERLALLDRAPGLALAATTTDAPAPGP
jgi:murein DD-endopeptidase MepM/ murein hydrolase activator NlpD